MNDGGDIQSGASITGIVGSSSSWVFFIDSTPPLAQRVGIPLPNRAIERVTKYASKPIFDCNLHVLEHA